PAHGDTERVVEGALVAEVRDEQVVEGGRGRGAAESAPGDAVDELPALAGDLEAPRLAAELVLELLGGGRGLERDARLRTKRDAETPAAGAVEEHPAAVDEDVGGRVERLLRLSRFVELDRDRAALYRRRDAAHARASVSPAGAADARLDAA